MTTQQRYRLDPASKGGFLLCGGIIPEDMVKPGQTWEAAGGHRVEVVDAQGGWVKYRWTEKGEVREHDKQNFAFQCRYCLVLNMRVFPDGLPQ